MSAEDSVPTCAGCNHLRRNCAPDCAFAPYFPPRDVDRFAAVHNVFGASNVSRLLAEFEPEERADAVELLLYQAAAHQKDPDFGCISSIALLQNMLRLVKGDVAAARVELEDHVDPVAAFQPYDTAAAPPVEEMGEAQQPAAAAEAMMMQQTAAAPVVQQMGEAQQAAAAAEAVMMQQVDAAAEAVMTQQTAAAPPVQQMGEAQQAAAAVEAVMMQQTAAAPPVQQMGETQQAAAAAQAVMMQQTAAAQQPHHRAVEQQHTRTVLGFPDVHPRQKMAQRIAKSSAAAAQAARVQIMMLKQAKAAAVEQHAVLGFPDGHPRQNMEQRIAESSAASAQAAREQIMMLQQAKAAAAQHPHHRAVEQHARTVMGFPDGHPRQKMAQRIAKSSEAAAQAAREQILMLKRAKAAAAQQHRHPVAQHGTGIAFPDGRVHGHLHQQTVQQVAYAQKSAAPHQVAKEQEIRRQLVAKQQLADARKSAAEKDKQRQLAACNQKWKQLAEAQQMTAAQKCPHSAEQYQAMGLEQQRQNQQTALQHAVMGYASLPHPQMAQAQQLAAAELIAWEQKTQDMMIELAAAAAGVTTDQYKMMMMQQLVAGGQQHHGQAEHYAAMGLTGDQNMTMMQQDVAGQQHHDQAQQYANMELDVTLGLSPMHLPQQLSSAVEKSREQELMIMQEAAAYVNAMPGSGSGATTMPFLTGGSAEAPPFPVEQQPQSQTQTVNAPGSPRPLPPRLADLPRQQQNDGGYEGQSSDLTAYFSIPYPDPPPDGR